MIKKYRIIGIIFWQLFFARQLFCQIIPSGYDFDVQEEDVTVGSDIFDDFNENIEETQILEDEQFYHNGRFYSFALSMGTTTFDGNRGRAYEDEPPTFGLNINYFLDFQSSFALGVEFSRHHFFLRSAVHSYGDKETDAGAGLVEVDMVRAFFSNRYYFNTSNLGTAITYSNPYLTLRVEYWYLSNEFLDQPSQARDKGGGLGVGLGGGLEFPIKIKESYIGVEFLVHLVNYHDKYTNHYSPLPEKTFGYEDLGGNCYSMMVSYVNHW